MTKFGIISDTHGLLRPQVKKVLQNCAYIFHCGDIQTPDILEELSAYAPVFAVRGNNDNHLEKTLPETLCVQIEGVRFFMIHDRKQLTNIPDCDVFLFGHSHKYFCERKNRRLYLNPGSCGKRRFRLELSMALLTIEKNNIEVCKISIPI